jgi:TrmH RNA methyltransferase
MPEKSKPREAPPKLMRIAGLPAVTALFAGSPERVERLYVDDRMKQAAGEFCAAMARARKPYRLVPVEELAKIAGSAMHGGIVALAHPVDPAMFDAKDAGAWAADKKLLLILDGIGNPQNLGAIARTAAFFGLPRMVLSDAATQAKPSDAAYRIAEGGLDRIALYRATRLPDALRQLRRSYHVVGTALGKGMPIETLKGGERPFAVVFGNEEAGLDEATLKACETVVTIPGAGGIQSLNVSASAAIFIHALLRQQG